MTGCNQTERMLAAVARRDGEPDLLAHLAECDVCKRAILEMGLSRAPVDRDELALHAAGMSSGAAAVRAEQTLRADPDLARDVERIRSAARRRDTAEGGARRLLAGIAVAACAAGVVLLQPELRPKGADDFRIAVQIGDRECRSTDEANPCRWLATTTTTMALLYRRELGAQEAYVVVVIRDNDGDVSPLYVAREPLRVTTDRRDRACGNGMCWLEGGTYDVVPGRAEIIAVAAPSPIDIDDVKTALQTGAAIQGRVFRFYLEVNR